MNVLFSEINKRLDYFYKTSHLFINKDNFLITFLASVIRNKVLSKEGIGICGPANFFLQANRSVQLSNSAITKKRKI